MNKQTKFALNFLLIFFYTISFGQEVRLVEGTWSKASGCSFCLTCECLKCPYEGSGTTNEGVPFSQTKYKEIPIIRETTTVSAYCGNKLIGEYFLERNNTCKGGYNYTSDLAYLRTKDGYLYKPQVKYYNVSGYNLIKKDAEGYCAAGETRKTVVEIEAIVGNQSFNLAADFPKTNVNRSEIAGFNWEDLRRKGTYSFGEEEVVCRTVALETCRRGNWTFLEDKQLIEIEWQASDYKPAMKEILSIVRAPDGKSKVYSTYENKAFSGPILKAYHYVNDEKVYEEEYLYLKENIGLNNFDLLRECGPCFWKGKTFQHGETVKYNSLVYEKEITFTCSTTDQGSYWASELLENPFFTTFKSSYCLVCDDDGKNSPGYFEDWKDRYGSGYKAIQCIVFKDKEKNKIVSKRLGIQKVQDLINPPDISFAPEKMVGDWNFFWTETHDWNTLTQIKEEERSPRGHNTSIYFQVADDKISGMFASRKSYTNKVSASGKFEGSEVSFVLKKYGEKRFKIKGKFISAVEFEGIYEPYTSNGKPLGKGSWGTIKGGRIKKEKTIKPVSEIQQEKIKGNSSSTIKESSAKEKKTSIDQVISNTPEPGNFKNLAIWTSSNAKKSMEEGIVSLTPLKKKKGLSFKSPHFNVGYNVSSIRFRMDPSKIKSGSIKVFVLDVESGEREEVYNQKIKFSLDEVNREIKNFGQEQNSKSRIKKFKNIKINVRKYRSKSIQIIIAYKATGLGKPPLYITDIR